MNKPLISVIIPTYNSIKTLGETLNSVIKQTYRPIEVLIINDGSTDDLLNFVKPFLDQYSFIHIISQENRGLAATRNTGINYSRGDFLAFIDADDIWLPEKLEKHAEHLLNNPSVGVSFSPAFFIDEFSAPIFYKTKPPLTNISSSDILFFNPVGCGSTPVIRKKVFNDIAYIDEKNNRRCFFDENFRQSEDIECWTRISLTTDWTFEGLAKPLTGYRLCAGGLSAVVSKQLASWEMMISKINHYKPDFLQDRINFARSLQLRYLCRRCLWMRDPKSALYFFCLSLKSSPSIIIKSPARTFVTFFSIVIQFIFPNKMYSFIEKKIMKWGYKDA